jgi:hypothetical protein
LAKTGHLYCRKGLRVRFSKDDCLENHRHGWYI